MCNSILRTEMRKYGLVLWDLDGTLADTSEGVINAVKYAGCKMNMPELSEETYRKFIGPPNRETYGKYWGLFGEELDRAIAFHKEYATTKGANQACLYNGIQELLVKIRQQGIGQAVVTLKLQESAERVLNYLGINSYLDYICGSSPEQWEKSKLLEKCIKEAGVSKGKCVLIGDSIYDQLGAKEVGIPFIGVTYGFGFSSEEDIVKNPYSYIANSTVELDRIILGRLG